MTFDEANYSYQSLRGQYAARTLQEAQFEAAVNQLRVVDQAGYTWQIGVNSGTWFRWDGQQWQEAVPPVTAMPPPAPIVQPPVQRPVQRAVSTETILGIIPFAGRKQGIIGLRQKTFTIIVTNQHLIFAYLTSQMQKEVTARAREQAKREGRGRFGQVFAMMGSRSMDHYYQMTPDQIIAEQPDNEVLALSQIHKVQIYQDDEANQHQIIFHTTTGKQKYRFSHLETKEVRDLLRQVLSNVDTPGMVLF